MFLCFSVFGDKQPEDGVNSIVYVCVCVCVCVRGGGKDNRNCRIALSLTPPASGPVLNFYLLQLYIMFNHLSLVMSSCYKP